MKIMVGTSGWLYRDWDGPFYPKELKDADKLPFYAQQFSTVEINSTFYHMPLAKSAAHWQEITPDNFVFTVKMNRYATHTKHLVVDDDTSDTLDTFFERVHVLGDKLGMILVQLPPSMRTDTYRLEHLSNKALEAGKRYAMRFPLALEFRHASWLTEEVFSLMRDRGMTHVINDSPNRWPAAKVITGDIAYVRFHGNKRLYRSSYTDEELQSWADYIVEQKPKQIFAYFNNDYDATAVRNAKTLQKFLTR